MRKALLHLSFGLGLVANMLAAGVSGRWVGDMASGNSVGSPTARIYLTFQRAGEAISGTVAYQDETKRAHLENAELKGDQLTFKVHDNPTRVVKFRLTLGENTLNGDATSGDRVIKIAMSRPN